jgi:uncharacterized protein YcbK (DUF882 family)
MITFKDYLMGRIDPSDMTPEQLTNANLVVSKCNELLTKLNLTSTVRSGYRRPEDNAAANGATHSKHMTFQACDLEDNDNRIKNAIRQNIDILVDIGVYCEDFGHTPTWTHVQIVPPKSGKRVFLP